MHKTIIASAVALALGSVGTAVNAASVNITQMVLNGTYTATGTLNDTASSAGTYGNFKSVQPFLGQPWTAQGVAFFDTAGAHEWKGGTAGVGQGTYDYKFTLTGNQVAWGTIFNWDYNNGLDVLNIMDCGASPTAGSACTGTGTPAEQGNIVGFSVVFNGKVAPTPLPASAWLMGSGLLGLVTVARRRKSG